LNFVIHKGEVFALAGESGCGKTTTGMLIAKLIEPTEGKIIFDGNDIVPMSTKKFKPYRKKIQIIFQDPYDSLDPRQTVYQIISEPLKIHRLIDNSKNEMERVTEMLKLLKLVPAEKFMTMVPHQLSGGQRQRVALARAMTLEPEFIIADEPVSMLDVSIRAEILNFFLEFREKFSTTIMYITHDLAVASYIADRIGIMYLGKIFEIGPVERVIDNPLNHYTQTLIASVPSTDITEKKRRTLLKGEPPSPINPPMGCRFHPRCPKAMDVCEKEEPILTEIEKEHFSACWAHKE